MIEIENLSKHFGRTKAVDQISLQIKKGEFFCFLGPNGAGKTTTIKLICGLLKPTSGLIKIGGIDIRKEPILAKRLLGYIPDQPYLYEKLTPTELLRFIADLYGVSDDGQKLLYLFEMAEYKHTLIEEFSHGMRQRIAFCATLIHFPEVIVIDEPMVGLDPKSVYLVKRILKERSKEGVTIFLSTHALSLAEELSDRVGIIHKGRLIADGSVEDLKEISKANKFEDLFLELTQEG
ncbi:MAG: ABC transporter ATP-binding protein [bacterium]|nr:ABC transporter ATP-binding protein [bacterium]